MTDTSIGKTILQQLGGQRFLTMTGASNLTAHPDGLRFRIPNSPKKVNVVDITLEGNDTYSMKFMRVWGRKVTTLDVAVDVYADTLQQNFTIFTGLHTRL